jgi:hypothetical protein
VKISEFVVFNNPAPSVKDGHTVIHGTQELS